MLSSIHPLGERARGNRWIATVLWYTAASTAAGALLGAVVGTIAAPLASRLPPPAEGALVLVACAAAVSGDLFASRRPFSWHRQVNEDWLVRYRAWLYASGFGFQLGLGVVTIITTYAIYAYLVMLVLSGSPASGALVGATFGFARALPVLATGTVRGPQQLRAFHRRLQSSASVVRHLSAATLLAAASAVVIVR